MLIDTHSHIYQEEEFGKDQDEVVQRLKDADVQKVILPNVDEASIAPLLGLWRTDKQLFRTAMGLHPTEVRDNYKQTIERILTNAFQDEETRDGIVAIGEIGIDLYWDKTFQMLQEDAFKAQVSFAIEKDLPIIIHQRDALAETLQCLASFPKEKLRGVFHCFGGTKEEAELIFAAGDFMLGIGGVLTYKKSEISKCASALPLHRIVLETDAPYLAPVPHRGKRNETAFIAHTAQRLAELTDKTFEEISATTSRNAISMFAL